MRVNANIGIGLILIFAILMGTGCSKSGPTKTVTVTESPSLNTLAKVSSPNPPKQLEQPWGEIHSWAYQLQNVNIRTLLSFDYDLLVLEPYPDGEDQPGISAGELRLLQDGGSRVLAYLSIGEAEDYRRYWSSEWSMNPPPWLDEENPDWKGNFKVRYWDEQWQSLIQAALLEKVTAGYDGVYFDLVDAYEHYEEQGRKKARKEMINFVKFLAAEARAENPDFKIFVQNAEELTEDQSYLMTIDGLGREEFRFGYEGRESQSTPSSESSSMKQHLKRVRAAGKIVLTVDYTNVPSQISQAKEAAEAEGFVPFFAPRELDSIVP